MTAQHPDLTPIVDLTRDRGAGPVRARRPVYVDLLAPCQHACPAGEDVRGWIGLVQAGEYAQAWLTLVRDNPMPGVLGRVCYHPCESACSRGAVDASVSIHAIERFLGDRAAENHWPLERAAAASGKRVLIVGAGPCGLAAAYHLLRLGHSAEIHEAQSLPGGMMSFGIPSYRLPRETLELEIGRLEAMGLKIVLNHIVEDVLAEQAAGRFDAVFVAVGAGVAKHIDIPARDAPCVLDALSLLRHAADAEAPQLGRRVVVYGGGDTAFDAARSARRLGAEETLIVYRRDCAHMPAHAFELAQASEENVQIKWLSAIKEIVGRELTLERMELDPQGRPRPTGRYETLPADAVVLAVGQETDSRFLGRVRGVEVAADGAVQVGPDMMTGHPGLFAGGDMVPGTQSVATAVGHGKRAALSIDAWLRGGHCEDPTIHALAGFEMLHLPVYSDADPVAQQAAPPAQRIRDFEEVVTGLAEAQARYEARRCFSCGHCFECDGCYAACPEHAIVKLGPGRGYRYDYLKCTGCAVCFEQCPCHAIEMISEP
jgi:formate dehydrogenase (NADP+) beta subunit